MPVPPDLEHMRCIVPARCELSSIMLPHRELRWAGAGISNGRQRLVNNPASTRHYTIRASQRHIPRLTRPSTVTNNLRPVQVRTLSLFGWGGSSNPSSTDGSTLPASSGAQNIDIGPSSLSNVRTIKASHATSDAPDPSLTQSAADGASVPVFDKLADAVAFPTGSDKFDHLLEDNSPIVATPEYVGYLKEACGLDYGWGPSSVMQYLFEHIHISGALGWTASIIVLSSVLRLSIVPAMVLSQKESQKMKDLAPHMGPIRQRYTAYMAEGNRVKAMEVAQEMRSLNKAANVKYSRMLIPLFIQLPFQFGAFRMLRGSADLPVPAYVDQPWLWNPDLSLSDPYYITPALSAGMIYLQFAQSQKQQTFTENSPMSPNMMKVVGRVIPAASFLFMFWQPGAVQLYFLVSSGWAYVSTFLLRQTVFRGMVGLPPLNPPVVAAAPTIAAPKGGLQTKSKLLASEAIKPEVEQPKPEQKRSIIDEGVDRIKSMVKASSPAKAVAKRVDDASQKQQKERARKYEQDHKRKLKHIRSERNQLIKGESTSR